MGAKDFKRVAQCERERERESEKEKERGLVERDKRCPDLHQIEQRDIRIHRDHIEIMSSGVGSYGNRKLMKEENELAGFKQSFL